MENLYIKQRIEICASNLKSWGERLAKDFKNMLKKSRERMDCFREVGDVFSIQY